MLDQDNFFLISLSILITGLLDNVQILRRHNMLITSGSQQGLCIVLPFWNSIFCHTAIFK